MGANASTAVPLYAAGQVLDAARLNLTNSGIPVFSGTATRDAAFGGSGEKVLAEGQFAYLEDSNALQFYDSAAWQAVGGARIGQVASTSKTDTFSTTSLTYTDITGLSVSITPTLATSKILVLANYCLGLSTDMVAFTQLVRGSTAISIGDTASNRARVTNGLLGMDAGTRTADQFTSHSVAFLDSPATTSATTYKLQMLVSNGTGYLNRTGSDTDNAQRPRGASNITVMEVIV